MKWISLVNEERTYVFGPNGSKDSSNWMSADTRRDRPRGDFKPRITVGGERRRTDSRIIKRDPKILKAEFKDKFPSIPSVSDIDGGFSNSIHQKAERVDRDAAIDAYAGGNGDKFIAVYWANRGNPSGSEYHWITDNGIIIITNDEKDGGRQIVTKLIARPGQIKRYPNGTLHGDKKYGMQDVIVGSTQVYPAGDSWRPPKDVLDIAQLHYDLGLNYMEE